VCGWEDTQCTQYRRGRAWCHSTGGGGVAWCHRAWCRSTGGGGAWCHKGGGAWCHSRGGGGAWCHSTGGGGAWCHRRRRGLVSQYRRREGDETKNKIPHQKNRRLILAIQTFVTSC
uniref:Uncharacterized protein n=1 Tax=Oncorhynchus mykiss TaxID=8022 RepID=A0A8K9WPK4_ONCMY